MPPFAGLTPSQPDLACCRGSDPGGVVRAVSADRVGRPGGEKSGLVSPNEQQEIRGCKRSQPFLCSSALVLVKIFDDPVETSRVDSLLSETACVPVATSPRAPLAEISALEKKV